MRKAIQTLWRFDITVRVSPKKSLISVLKKRFFNPDAGIGTTGSLLYRQMDKIFCKSRWQDVEFIKFSAFFIKRLYHIQKMVQIYIFELVLHGGLF
jgi:hypothetical protein